MEKEKYVIHISIAESANIEFDALYLPGSDTSKFSYARIGIDGLLHPESGMITINEQENWIGFLCDIFDFTMHIEDKKEADGNILYSCSNGLGKQTVSIRLKD